MDHIEYLRSFVPFGKASYSDIVTELQEDVGSAIPTKALETANEICATGKGLLILTGNAGHGKTFIAREILLHFQGKDRTSEQSQKFVIEQLNGAGLKDPGIENEDGKKLAIHLDLSHTNEEEASKYIDSALNESGKRATLVCVNEGKLRQIISRWKGSDNTKTEIRQGLDDCIRRGIASRSDHLCFINLNFQSVVSDQDGRGSILEQALESWIDNDAEWASCESCLAQGECPIYRNRELLKITGDKERDKYPIRRRAGISFLFRLAELYGHPTTIREMLQLIAYMVTGGKSCADLRSLKSENPLGGWQSKLSFHRLIFGPDLDKDSLRQLPLIRKIRLFDPASFARRISDDQYIVSEDAEFLTGIDTQFIRANRQIEGAGVTMRGDKKEGTGTESGKEEQYDLMCAISILRRRDFFDLAYMDDGADPETERSERVGVQHYAPYIQELKKDGQSDDDTDKLKRDIIKGLNAVQGVSPWAKNGSRRLGNKLALLHPAFIRLENPYKALNKDIGLNACVISSVPPSWSDESEVKMKVRDTTDYSPVNLYFSVKVNNKKYELPLSLERFSYIVQAGKGCFSKAYHAADIARIHSFMSMLSDKVPDDEVSDSMTVIHDRGDFEYQFSKTKISI